MEKEFKFSGTPGGLFINVLKVYFTILLTLGIGTPWAVCRLERWKADHTTIDGRKIQFNGNGSDLFGKFLIGYFLTLITLGIYIFWFAITVQKFLIENRKFID